MSTTEIHMTEIQQQALSNAVSHQSTMNYGAIFEGFIEKGIPEQDIRPRGACVKTPLQMG